MRNIFPSTYTKLGLTFLITLAAFYFPLYYAWHFYPWPHLIGTPGISIYSTLGSYIPYSDAAGYYNGAQTLMHSGSLTAWASRRPLNAMFLATRLFWVGHHLKDALLFQSILCATSVFMAGLVIRKMINNFIAVLFIAACFRYIGFYLPTTLSTPFGFLLGAFAIVLLLEAIPRRNIYIFCAGSFILTIALFVRNGAFFVLPFLALWCGLYFKNDEDKISWKSIFACCIAIFTAYALNSLLFKIFSPPHAASMGNFALTVFGLITGKGWSYTYVAFPNLKHLSSVTYYHMVYEQSWKIFLEHPLILFKTLLNNLSSFARSGFYGNYIGGYIVLIIFGAISRLRVYGLKTQLFRSPQIISVMAMFAWLAVTLPFPHHHHALGYFITFHCIGYLYYLYRKKLPVAGMLLFSFIAILISSSILWADGGRRVFSSTMPLYITAYLVVLYYFLFPNKMIESIENTKTIDQPKYWLSKASATIVITLLILTIATSSYFKISQTHPPAIAATIASDKCPAEYPQMIEVNNTPKAPSMVLTAQQTGKPNSVNAKHFMQLLAKSSIDKYVISELTKQAKQVLSTKEPLKIKLLYVGPGPAVTYFIAPPDYFRKLGKLYFCQSKHHNHIFHFAFAVDQF